MELKEYFSVLSRRKWTIIMMTLVTVAVVLGITLYMQPQYTASTTLRIATAGGSLENVQFGDIGYADRLLNTFGKIAISDATLKTVQAQMGLSTPPKITVDIPANTELLTISAKDSNPQRAASEANSIAQIVMTEASNLSGGANTTNILNQQLTQAQADVQQAQQHYDQLSQSTKDPNQLAAARQAVDLKQQIYNQLLSQYASTQLSAAIRSNAAAVIEPAIPPANPSEPNKPLNLAAGLLLGLVAGTGLAFLFDNLDPTLKTNEEIERVVQGLVLAKIPTVKRRKSSTLFDGNSAEEEAFRHLRTNLLGSQDGASLHAILITSAESGEGKSTITANLARALAQSGRKVVVLDADLRLPTVHRLFKVQNQVGLSSVLKREMTLQGALQATSIPGLTVLTSGPLPPDPTQLLGSPEMIELVRDLEQRFDMVLIDTPALLTVSDASVLASAVDGVLLVVARARSRGESVQSAEKQLATVRVNPLGIVVNRAEPDGTFYYGYYRNGHRKN